ncbi:unnamed protein product [Adineta steineri]|uniref:Nose resistant-to-fluoxetine protein N-terminal domain-containing protein n=1 Tax=Adineta steineri TaxID=433720 RepID=A0A819M322_9BILA|nr:unnamed protein product [Adineta steineri]
MIVCRFLLCIVLINTLLAYESWTFPRSTSFHHTLELFHARATTSHPSFSFTLSSLLSFVVNETHCHDDLLLLMNGFLQKEKWALKIIDSWGIKPPAGLLEGSHLWLGSYDECLHSLYLPTNRTHVIQPYHTKYCTVSSPSNTTDDDNVFFAKPALIIGICLPISCHSHDFHIESLAIQCRSDERYFSIGTTYTISLIILLSLFVCFATFIPFLNEYSPITTLKKIFSLKKSPSTYSFINGIRAISLLWIILGHSYTFYLTIADNVVHIFDNIHNSLLLQLIVGAVYGVDTFFFISGFLAVSVFVTTFQNQNVFRIQHLFCYYFHRYCRLIPTLVFVLLISMHLSPWMGSGPIFPTLNGFEVPTCHNHWWATILFLNNFISPTQACLPVTWYIANDFQFHLLAPILLIPFILNRRRLTYALLLIILLINIITTICIISTNPHFEGGLIDFDSPSLDFFEKVYITPWCRIGPFIIGMITRLIIEQYHSTLSKIKIILYTIISIILAMICIYFPFYSNYFPKFFGIIYQSLSRQCWAIAVGWLIFACSTNHGGLINKILSWPLWTIIARLSYSAYLIHPIIILIQVYNHLTTIHYQTSIVLNNFISQIILTLFTSIFVVILVEMPCSLFEKQIRKHYNDKKQMPINQQTYGTIS